MQLDYYTLYLNTSQIQLGIRVGSYVVSVSRNDNMIFLTNLFICITIPGVQNPHYVLTGIWGIS